MSADIPFFSQCSCKSAMKRAERVRILRAPGSGTNRFGPPPIMATSFLPLAVLAIVMVFDLVATGCYLFPSYGKL